MGARAVMGIWAGLDREIDGAHRVVPIIWEDNAWKLLPTHVCVTVRVYEGVFPLREAPHDWHGMIEDAPPSLSPDEIKAMEEEEQAAEDEEQSSGQYTVDKVLGHVHHTDGGDTEFHISYEGYDSTHDRWYTADALPCCQELINQYIADNHKEYYEGMVMSGAVTAIKAIKDDEQMYEMEKTRMRAEARLQSATLPMYPEFMNK